MAAWAPLASQASSHYSPPAAASNNATQQHQRYPSPRHNSLPFYQSAEPQHRNTRDRDDVQTRSGASENGHGDGQDSDATAQPIPDDPQLRQNLNHMMGTFRGTYPAGLPPQYLGHHGPDGHMLPPGSVAFAQATNSPDAAPPNPLRQRERSKVSRACDECRRKKIRCDAVDETGQTPCSNCARTGARCAFSRQPMKRGPSKGYIKDLAERLNSLESQVGRPEQEREIRELRGVMAEQGVLPYGGRDDGQYVPTEPRTGEKRSRDVAEGGSGSGGQVTPVHAHSYPSQVPTAQMMQPPAQPGSVQQMPPNPFQTATPQPPPPPSSDVQPFWRRGANDFRHETVGQPYEAENSTMITSFDWDEQVIDEYYRLIHQTFPLLPSSKHRLRQGLADCPATLREACLAALDCLMRTFPTTTLQPNAGYPQALKKAAELLAGYPFDKPSSHTSATNLVYLQTLLLMALESDNHGPATIRGQAGPSRAEWLGRAAGVAGQLEINVIHASSQQSQRSVMAGDRDSEERLARRVWWVLFILDRWHASSTADLLKLPENSVVLLPEDQILLGESTYHLARLSFIIGHLAAILTTTKTPSTDVMAPSNPASSLLGLTLAGEIDRFRESVESVWGSLNLVHLSYHHCHLLIKRLNPNSEPTELVGHAVKVATVLNSRLTPVTPLNHHFGALAAMTLCELCDVPKTRAEALKGLEQMIECLGEGRGLAGRQESEGWDGAVRELVVSKKGMMLAENGSAPGAGLESLANVAVGGSEGFDPTMLTRYGYLTALGQGTFRTK
ncbi:hypothetical protein B0A50_05034 [Salinomyces thailandicus]|uniref:Zn(2)-C6 fungal-type domain-containing protein n=1 Tax=Salinomyces thailandicus TaxID=706561 RepID=A0A4U0TZ91_9PEZI|nr:hypothetical protein B0A50_05034 [Salinomyces thailandica]